MNLKLFIITTKDVTTAHVRQALLHHSLTPTTILTGGTHNYKAVEQYGKNNGIPIDKYSPKPGNLSWKVRCQQRLITLTQVCDAVLFVMGKEPSLSLDFTYDLVSSPSFLKPFYLYGVSL